MRLTEDLIDALRCRVLPIINDAASTSERISLFAVMNSPSSLYVVCLVCNSVKPDADITQTHAYVV